MPRLSLFLCAAVGEIRDKSPVLWEEQVPPLLVGRLFNREKSYFAPVEYIDDFLFSLAASVDFHHDLRQLQRR